MFLDTTYILVLIGAVITMIASGKLKSTYAKYAGVRAACGLTGKDVAVRILRANGIYDVSVGHVSGSLTDHYDPANKIVNLSDDIYSSTSVAALGVAAHECGHAIQDNIAYAPLRFRTSLVPIVNLGSKLSWPLIIAGILLGSMSRGAGNLSYTLLQIGIFAFALVVLFQLVTLPVEYNASDRALDQLHSLALLDSNEEGAARKVLKAAALTYVASAASGLLQLLRLILLFGGNRNKRN